MLPKLYFTNPGQPSRRTPAARRICSRTYGRKRGANGIGSSFLPPSACVPSVECHRHAGTNLTPRVPSLDLCLSQACEEDYCFPRDLSRHAVDVPVAAAKGQALSASWVLKYQQAGEGVIGDLYRQSDPACFLHGAADWCVDRAAGPAHALPLFHDLFEGAAFEHEWVDPASFPRCPVQPKNLHSQPFLMLNLPVPASPSSVMACLRASVFEDKVVTGRECEEEGCPYGRPAARSPPSMRKEREEAGREESAGGRGRRTPPPVKGGRGGGAGGGSATTPMRRSSPAPSSPRPPLSPRCSPSPPARHDKHQQLRLAHLPRYVCLRLLRFDNSLKKIRTPVAYEETIDFGHFVSREEEAGTTEREGGAEAHGGAGVGGKRKRRESVKGEGERVVLSLNAEGGEAAGGQGSRGEEQGVRGPSEYELMSVVLHQGRTRQRGHYYLYQRVLEGVEGGGESGKWWLFDDAKRYQEVEACRVLRASDEVYMLVYRRRDRAKKGGGGAGKGEGEGEEQQQGDGKDVKREEEGEASMRMLGGEKSRPALSSPSISSSPSSTSSLSSSSTSSSSASAGTSTSAATVLSTGASALRCERAENKAPTSSGRLFSGPVRKRPRPLSVPVTVMTDLGNAWETAGEEAPGEEAIALKNHDCKRGRRSGKGDESKEDAVQKYGIQPKAAVTPRRKRAASR